MALYFAFVEELWAGLEQYDIAAPLHPANSDEKSTPAAGDEVIVCLRGAFIRNRKRLRIEEVARLNDTHYAVRLRFPMM
ncbi:MAG: hypothetical protein ACOC9X_05715 [bacterium]